MTAQRCRHQEIPLAYPVVWCGRCGAFRWSDGKRWTYPRKTWRTRPKEGTENGLRPMGIGVE